MARRTGPTPDVEEMVSERDQGRCVRCGEWCWGEQGRDWSYQHRWSRGSGGTRRPEVNRASNLCLLCGSGTTRCHGWVTGHPLLAKQSGWALDRGVDPRVEPIVHAVHGRVLLDDDGGWVEAA